MIEKLAKINENLNQWAKPVNYVLVMAQIRLSPILVEEIIKTVIWSVQNVFKH